jgi:hypothetical protein
MLRFYAEPFVQAMAALSGMNVGADVMANVDAPVSDDLRKTIYEVLAPLDGQIAKLPFSYSLRRQYARFKRTLETSVDAKELSLLGYELRENMIAELASKVFLMIPEENAEFYRQPEPPFGKDVADTFPEATYDIAAAGRCIALDEWTAAVFHLMRVHEIALRHLGRKLRITVAKQKTIDFQDWQVIIAAVDQTAKTSPKGSQGGAKAARKREFYSEASGYLFHIKQAWRIPVMHARATFDERLAMIIWENTKALMYLLAVREP